MTTAPGRPAPPAPEVSIVVASFGSEAMLEGCLGSLRGERGDAEVVVVARFDEATRERLGARFPWVSVWLAPPGTSVFALRSAGIFASRGRVVALLEDHVRVAPGWRQALVDAVRAGAALAGGPVVHQDPASLWTFALYLVEYSALMPPLADGEHPILLAVNAAYARAPILAVAESWRSGFHDNEVQDALAAWGHEARAVPTASVTSAFDLPWPESLAHLWRGGRRYGAYRRARSSRRERTWRPLFIPLLPFLLLGRILGRVAHRQPARLAQALLVSPLLLVLLAAWSFGELVSSLTPAPRLELTKA